jgi:hypothetical protein
MYENTFVYPVGWRIEEKGGWDMYIQYIQYTHTYIRVQITFISFKRWKMGADRKEKGGTTESR